MSDIDKIYEYIGTQIKYYRNKISLNQEELAKNTGLTRTSIVHIEKGGQRVPIDKLYKIARVLKRPVYDFLPKSEEIFKTFDDISKGRLSEEEKKLILNKLKKE